MPRKVEISHRTIIFTVFFIISLWFLFYIREILFQLFVAVFVMCVLNPSVKKLNHYRVPKPIAVSLIYITGLVLLVLSIGSIIPALIEQTTNFANNLPVYLDSFGIPSVIIDQISSEFVTQIGSLPSQVLRVGLEFFSNLLEIITVLIISFYLIMSREKLDKQLEYFLGNKVGRAITDFISELEVQLGGWARGQLALMLLVGVTSYIGFTIIGIPYALPLALIAGFLEAVPYVGPILAAVPALIIGFGISPILGLATIALAFLIQQLESYFFVPKVMERSIGVNPIVTLLALAIGFRIAGIGGVLMSLPVVIALKVLYKQHLHKLIK